MAAYVKIYEFVKDLGEEIHNFGSDTLAVALTAAANAPTQSNTVLADLTEISYTNCSSRNITTSSWSQTSGTAKLICADLTLTATGGAVGPFRYVVIYNSSAAANNLICYFDYGSEITLNAGESLLIDFDGVNGVFTLA